MNTHPQPAHLDADQLNAFAEGTLPEHERLAALSHLSTCADCRNIVFLAQSAAPIAEPTTKPEPFWRSWLTIRPLLTIAAAAACTLLVITVVHQKHNIPTTPTTVATNEPPPAKTQPNVTSTPPPAQERQRITTPPAHRNDEPPVAVAAAPPAPVKQPIAIAGAMPSPAIPAAQAIAGRGAGTAVATQSQQIQATSQAVTVEASAAAPVLVANAATLDAVQAEGQPKSMAAMKALTPSTARTFTAPTEDASVDAYTLQNTARANTNKLPSHQSAVSTANLDGRTLAVDADGNVYLSLDTGHEWTVVFPRWQGRAVHISIAQDTPQALAKAKADKADQNAAAAGSLTTLQQTTRNADTSTFRLTTDNGEVWVSNDGFLWRQR